MAVNKTTNDSRRSYTKTGILSPEIKMAIIAHLSSACSEAIAGDPEQSPLLAAASQFNLDLSTFAQCEAEGELDPEDLDCCIYDMFRSPMYWKLRETFVEEASGGSPYAFLHLVWRAYSAGRLSTDRYVPETPAQRRDRHQQMTAQTMAQVISRECGR